MMKVRSLKVMGPGCPEPMELTQTDGGRPGTRATAGPQRKAAASTKGSDKPSLYFFVVTCKVNLPCFQTSFCQFPKHALSSCMLRWSGTMPGQTQRILGKPEPPPHPLPTRDSSNRVTSQPKPKGPKGRWGWGQSSEHGDGLGVCKGSLL